MRLKQQHVLIVGLILLLALLVPSLVSADGIFDPCTYLNDCETFTTKFTAKNHKDGILVQGVVPDAHLANSGNQLEVIVTTGDVYTRCANKNGVRDITGDILWRGNVTPGWFSMYIPLAEGKYNITIYLGQTECANCPQAWVKAIDVKHNVCEKTGEYVYTIPGKNFDCITEPVSPENGGGTWAINRFRNPDYTATFCYRCGEAQVGADHSAITKRAVTTCDIPMECTACP